MIKTNNNQNGFALIGLMIVIVIIAVIVYMKGGFMRDDKGRHVSPTQVKVQTDDMEKKVDEYNKKVNEQVNN